MAAAAAASRAPSRPPRLQTAAAARSLSSSNNHNHNETGQQDTSRFQLKQHGADDPPRLTCTSCGWIHYQNPKVVVGWTSKKAQYHLYYKKICKRNRKLSDLTMNR